jgi:hypothetical protein
MTARGANEAPWLNEVIFPETSSETSRASLSLLRIGRSVPDREVYTPIYVWAKLIFLPAAQDLGGAVSAAKPR